MQAKQRRLARLRKGYKAWLAKGGRPRLRGPRVASAVEPGRPSASQSGTDDTPGDLTDWYSVWGPAPRLRL